MYYFLVNDFHFTLTVQILSVLTESPEVCLNSLIKENVLKRVMHGSHGVINKLITKDMINTLADTLVSFKPYRYNITHHQGSQTQA